MYLIVILLFLFYLLWIILKRQNNIEKFYPAWQDATIYSKLSRRLKVGIWKGWLNINNLLLTNQLLKYTNIDIIFFETNKDTIHNLLTIKTVDIVITTEADYGIYISNSLQDILKTDISTKKTINKNKNKILDNFNTRRLFTFYDVYRILLVDNVQINKPSDLSQKVIEITNITNNIYKLDLDLLSKINYIQLYRSTDRGKNKYDSINKLGLQINGYFTQYDYPNLDLTEISKNKNSTIIDLFSNENNDYSNKILEPDIILDKYFYLSKGRMKLDAYPEIKKRRKQVIEMNNLPYDPNYVNCYKYKMMMITREDVNDEWIYLFTKDIIDNINTIKQNVPYLHEVTKKGMYISSLSDILPMHRAVYKEK